MAGRAQGQAARMVTVLGILAGTALSLVPISFPLLDLTYIQPTDPPVIIPVMIWPLAPVKFAVGLLFGPVAGLIAGLASQVLSMAFDGMDLTQTWNWILAAGLGGFIAGWLPRHLPSSWRPSGQRRLAGAAMTGVLATTIGFLPIFLDPLLRPGVTGTFALGEYVTVVGPTSILAALTLALVLAAGLRLGVHTAIRLPSPAPAARPGWQPFAMAFALAVAVPLAPLYVSPNVRLIGPVGSTGGPAAAPDPSALGSADREVSVSLGDPPTTDGSCESEGKVHSTAVWTAVEVTLYNETGTHVGVAWLDYEGHRDENVAIPPGPLYGTWGAGHLFMFTGPDGGCLMIFKVLGTAPITIHLRS